VTGTESFATLFNEGEGVGPKPLRVRRITHVYSTHYYATRIKAEFEAEWARVSAEGDEDGGGKAAQQNQCPK
jgi:hypothetical protein